MGKVWIWFFLSVKRHLKRPANLVLLLLFPLVVSGMSGLERKGDGKIAVALYAGEAGLPQELAGLLTAHEGMFRFYRCPSLEALEADVASRRAECGFALPDDLEGRLDAGRHKRSVQVYTAPSTVMAPLACEVVSAALLTNYGKELYLDYMESGFLSVQDNLRSQDLRSQKLCSPEEREEALKALDSLYEARLSDGSTYSFAYRQDGQAEGAVQEARPRVFPARGLASVYVFVAGLYAAVTLLGDERRGLLSPLPSSSRGGCAFASVMAPVALAGGSAAVAIWMSGAWSGLARELAAMAAYVLLAGAVSFLLGRLIRSPEALCCSIPFWIIGSLILCPVFVDLGQWVPSLSGLGKLFPPYYYLLPFH